MLVEFYAPIKPTLLDNKIRAVATSGTERSPFFSDVPTAAQAGVAGYEVTSWNGLFAPVGTPAEIIDLLNKTVREIVATPEVKERYADLGIEAQASTPEALKKRLTDDIAKWAAVVEHAGIPRPIGMFAGAPRSGGRTSKFEDSMDLHRLPVDGDRGAPGLVVAGR